MGPNVLLISGNELLKKLNKDNEMSFSIVVKFKEETKPKIEPLPIDVEIYLRNLVI